MNRFKIAWEHIKTLKGSNFGHYYSKFDDSGLAFEEDEKHIDELVDMATPKKVMEVINDKWGEEYYCPICGEWLVNETYECKYCPNCGQALDWGEDDE